jgi:acetoin utilization deacetylase AcuC-like enzyme
MAVIPVYYDLAQIHDAGSYSRSPLKPKQVAAKFASDPEFEFVGGFMPTSAEELYKVHQSKYVDSLIAGTKADGFGNKNAEHNLAIRTAVANYLAAVKAALDGAPVVWSLTSGFHHAHYARAEGFCTFNALMLAAVNVDGPVLIVDEDMHYPDGCMDIKELLELDNVTILQSSHTHGDVDLDEFKRHLDKVIDKVQPKVILYQSGADMWLGDPLGGTLTMAEMAVRDRIVLRAAKARRIPIVVNLAGGYAHNYQDTIQIHVNTGRAIKEVFNVNEESAAPNKRGTYRKW